MKIPNVKPTYSTALLNNRNLEPSSLRTAMPSSSSYLLIQNDVDNVFLNENSECQTYFLQVAQ